MKIYKSIMYSKDKKEIAVYTTEEQEQAFKNGYRDTPAAFINKEVKSEIKLDVEPEKELVSEVISAPIKEEKKIKRGK